MSDAVISCSGLGKAFQDGDRQIEVLSGVDFSLRAGERVAIVGQSGCGKSTLLNLLGGLEVPTTGRVYVAGEVMSEMSDLKRSQWRNQRLGFVFQFHHLLPEFTALEAVAMPARIAGASKSQANQLAAKLLERVGLQDRGGHRPAALSGGERQRVAIARALINNPRCVLMDEPTGNLDPESAAQILTLMESLEWGQTGFVVVTHDRQVANQMARQLTLIDGRLVGDHDAVA
jgi:lipoprotein-releasing system ATP-binding protein